MEDLCIEMKNHLRVISIDKSSSLWDTSRENFFEVLE